MALRAFPVVYASWDAMLARLDGQVRLRREAEDMPWGERIATVVDPEGDPVALCQVR
jgi:uncharacterized glyoxalase superfamily protein PhnB